MPGPRVVVRSVAIDSTAPLAPRTPTRDEPWRDRLDKLRATWPLRAGEPFRQAGLERRQERDARRAARRRLSARRPGSRRRRASMPSSSRAALVGHARAAGRCFTSAPIRIEGMQRYDEAAVRRLATFSPGDVVQREAAARLPGAAPEARPVRRRLGRARRRPGRRRRRRCIVKVKELLAAPGDGRRRLQRQHRPARLARALGPQGVRPALDRAQHAHARPRPEVARHASSPPTRSRTCGATCSPPTSSSCAAADETRNSWTVRVGRSQDTTASSACTTLEARARAGRRARR